MLGLSIEGTAVPGVGRHGAGPRELITDIETLRTLHHTVDNTFGLSFRQTLGPAREEGDFLSPCYPRIGRLGAGALTIFSMQRQEFFGRPTAMTLNFAVIISTTRTSSSTRLSSPSQSAHVLPRSS